MIEITPLSHADPAEIEALLDTAFGNDRHTRTAYRLREGTSWLPELSFAAFEGDALVGTLQSWPVILTTAEQRRRSSAHPDRPGRGQARLQRGGVGKRLMTALIEAAQVQDCDAMVMIGDPEYYDRFFGFSNAATAGWSLPGPFEQRRLLARISRPGGLPAHGVIGPDRRQSEKPIAA